MAGTGSGFLREGMGEEARGREGVCAREREREPGARVGRAVARRGTPLPPL